MASLSHQLSFLSRHRLAQVLDQDNIRGCDWRALVEQMGFTYEMVTFLRDKRSPTMSLLEEWEMKEGNAASLDALITMIENIDNRPALDVVKDVRANLSMRPAPVSPRLSTTYSPSTYTSHHNSVGETNNFPEKSSDDKLSIDQSNLSTAPPPYSVSDSSSNVDLKQVNERLQELAIDKQRQELSESNNEKELRGRTLSALDCSLLLQGHEFDVFLSFASPDKDFAEEMRLRLVHKANISVYIPSEGLMPGQSFQDEIADKIKRGCRKTVIIMSPDYIDSSWCNYEARLAHHKNPDPRRHVLIPVMYRKCNVPDFISYLFYLDYPRYKDNPKTCEQHFWDRLYKSIRLPQK